MNSRQSRFERIQRAACWLILLAGVLAIVVDLTVGQWHLPGTHWFLPAPIGTIVGGVLIIASVGLRFTQPQPAIFSCFFVYAAAAALALEFRNPTTGDVTLQPVTNISGISNSRMPIVHVSDIEWYHKHTQEDPRWGHTGIANIAAEHHHREFDVTYTFDEEGWRRMPSPVTAPPRGEIWFLGCSFTLGIGVDDEETYAYLLAAGPWKEFRVRNYSHSAWGTSHAYLFLKERLKESPKPNGVVYVWISRHAARNYKRKSWHQGTGLKLPLFDVENGELKYFGLVPQAKADWPDGETLDEKEVEVTLALIHAMQRLCQEHGVPFALLAINDGEPKSDLVLPKLRADSSIPLIDLTRVTVDLHPMNQHPTRYYQRDIARAIAADETLKRITGIADLWQPKAFSQSPREWRLSGIASTGAWAKIERPDDIKSPVRVVEIHAGSAKPYELLLRCRHLPLKAKKQYTLRIRARADKPRQLHLNVSQDHPPWSILGFTGKIDLTEKPRDFEFQFTCPIDESDACVMIQLADSEVPFEIESISLSDGKINLIEQETVLQEDAR